MYTATITVNATIETLVGTMDEVTEWLATHHDGWDIDAVLTAMLGVITYGHTRGDITTSAGRFHVQEVTA